MAKISPPHSNPHHPRTAELQYSDAFYSYLNDCCHKIGKYLKSSRKSSGITQEKLAEAGNLSLRRIISIEQGDTSGLQLITFLTYLFALEHPDMPIYKDDSNL